MKKLKTTYKLLIRSLSVIKQNKILIIFPVIAMVFCCILAAIFFAPFILRDTGHALTEPAHWKALGDQLEIMAEQKDAVKGTISFAWFAVVYLFSMFIATFFNVAFYNEIICALNGKQVSVLRGTRVAVTKVKSILVWSVFAGSVGLVIRMIEEKLDFIGRWVLRLIGITFSVAAIFAVPIIIRDEKHSNPMKLLKTSALMLKKCWGEGVTGFIGIGFGFVIGFTVLLLLFVVALTAVITTTTALWAVLATLSIFIIGMLAFAVIWSMVDQIFRCALYVYASEGVIPGPFDREMMDMAWKIRKTKHKK